MPCKAPDRGKPVPGRPALEKAGRAILHRRRSILREARGEGRRVMRLLVRAALRTVPPTLHNTLGLIGGLLAVLTHSCVLARSALLNLRIKKQLKAWVNERYGPSAGLVLSWTEIRLRRRRKPHSGAERVPEPGTGASAMASRHAGQRRDHRTRRPIIMGADLPRTLEQFQALVRLAFLCSPPGTARCQAGGDAGRFGDQLVGTPAPVPGGGGG